MNYSLFDLEDMLGIISDDATSDENTSDHEDESKEPIEEPHSSVHHAAVHHSGMNINLIPKRLLLLYVSEDDTKTPISTFFMDLAKMTELNLHNLIVVIYYSSYSFFGSYEITLSSSKTKKKTSKTKKTSGVCEIKMERKQLDLSDPETLTSFVKKSQKKYPNRSTSLVLATHSTKWYVIPGGNTFFTIPQMVKNFQENDIKLDILTLDTCYGSTLELLYELKDITRYIVANEYYSPDFGFISKEMLRSFDTINSLKTICKNIAKDFILRNESYPNGKKGDITKMLNGKSTDSINKSFLKMFVHPTDVSVIDTDGIAPLLEYMRGPNAINKPSSRKRSTLKGKTRYKEAKAKGFYPIGTNASWNISIENKDIVKKFKLVSRDSYYFNYDLHSAILNSLKNKKQSNKKFQSLFDKMVVYYNQNQYLRKLPNSKSFHGVSFYPYVVKGFVASAKELKIYKWI